MVHGAALEKREILQELERAVEANSWITKYGGGQEYGVGDDEYADLCRAECVLAVWLFKEGREVAFVDEDRAEVLQGVAKCVEAERGQQHPREKAEICKNKHTREAKKRNNR